MDARTIESVTAAPFENTPPSRTSGRAGAYRWRRIAATAVVVVALMALGLMAGRWQWGRYEAKASAVAGQERAAGLPTVPLGAILATDQGEPGAAEWRTVTWYGVIDSSNVVSLRGRSVEGTASIQYLAWAYDETGEAVLLNLGWTPRSDPQTPRLPAGPVTVTGTVRALEADNNKQGTRITAQQMTPPAARSYPAYLMVESACGVGGCLTGVEAVPLPNITLGPHLSYALQWYLLMVAAAPIAVWLTVRDARIERERGEATASVSQRATVPHERYAAGSAGSTGAGRALPHRRPPSDEEIEDAL